MHCKQVVCKCSNLNVLVKIQFYLFIECLMDNASWCSASDFLEIYLLSYDQRHYCCGSLRKIYSSFIFRQKNVSSEELSNEIMQKWWKTEKSNNSRITKKGEKAGKVTKYIDVSK